jgi:sugar-specific transcriptional regulator TrmB
LGEVSDEREISVNNLLTRFGLSEDEALFFVLLSRVSKKQTIWLKGSDISRLSKKGRVRTYQILQRLLNLGLVNVDLSRPKKYSTVSPQVALHRLLSIQESKLTELSHLEEEVIESLRNLDPISTEVILGEEVNKGKSLVSLLQGLANIQTALREVISGAEVFISINDDSVEHIFTMLKFISEKTKSARVVFSTTKRAFPSRYLSLSNDVELFWRHGGSPTFIIAKDVTMFLFYSKTSIRKKLLSPEITVNTASQLTVVNSETYADQIRSIFELMLKNSSKVESK